ncbi:hypothetical protein S40293_11412 [Stachybotrys chartarum IBT 40293]|nr:hypothetical protein S40293_11412 [Stachybotrys chartarum IBT 40293]
MSSSGMDFIVMRRLDVDWLEHIGIKNTLKIVFHDVAEKLQYHLPGILENYGKSEELVVVAGNREELDLKVGIALIEHGVIFNTAGVIPICAVLAATLSAFEEDA